MKLKIYERKETSESAQRAREGLPEDQRSKTNAQKGFQHVSEDEERGEDKELSRKDDFSLASNFLAPWKKLREMGDSDNGNERFV